MNSEIKQIDAELDKMDDSTVAIAFTDKEDLPDEIRTLFDDTPTFHLDYDGEQIEYLNLDKGFSKGDMKRFMDSQQWGHFHPDGQAHLESIKRDIKNQQRKQRRMRFR